MLYVFMDLGMKSTIQCAIGKYYINTYIQILNSGSLTAGNPEKIYSTIESGDMPTTSGILGVNVHDLRFQMCIYTV